MIFLNCEYPEIPNPGANIGSIILHSSIVYVRNIAKSNILGAKLTSPKSMIPLTCHSTELGLFSTIIFCSLKSPWMKPFSKSLIRDRTSVSNCVIVFATIVLWKSFLTAYKSSLTREMLSKDQIVFLFLKTLLSKVCEK